MAKKEPNATLVAAAIKLLQDAGFIKWERTSTDEAVANVKFIMQEDEDEHGENSTVYVQIVVNEYRDENGEEEGEIRYCPIEGDEDFTKLYYKVMGFGKPKPAKKAKKATA